MTQKPAILFMHGAGLGSYIWDEVSSILDTQSLALDFPNREDENKPNLTLSYQDYLDHVSAQIDAWNSSPFIIVAHSISGCLALSLADRYAQNLTGILGIGAIFPQDGNSFVSSLPFPQKVLLPILMRILGTKPPEKAIIQGLAKDLVPEKGLEIAKRFTPESKRLYTSSVSYTQLPPSRGYIKLSKDNEIPLNTQEQMIKNLKADQIFELESAHLPMMSHAKKVAEIIEEFRYFCC